MPLGEIFKTANDRLKSPFLSSFLFSWIIFNWKAIFVAFAGDENVHTKIDCIENDYIDFYSLFLYPLLVALFYTIAFPFITVFFQLLTEKARIWSIEFKSGRENLKAKKEHEIEKIKAGTDDLKELNEKNENLNLQIEDLENNLKKIKSQNLELSKSTKSKKEIMDKSLELTSKIRRWITPFNSRNDTYINTYEKIRTNNDALSFLDSKGDEIENKYSIDLHPSDQNQGYKVLRQLKLFRIVSDKDNIHTITFDEIGENIWEIRKFALRDGRDILFPES